MGTEIKMRTFNVDTQTATVDKFAFSGNQKQRADETHAVLFFKWRDIRGNVNSLPLYVKNAIFAAGFKPVCLGGTTFSHSVIGLTVA